MNEDVLEDGLEDVNWPALCWCRFLSVGLGEKVQAFCFAEVRNDVSAFAHMRTSSHVGEFVEPHHHSRSLPQLANLLSMSYSIQR